ncbi:MAG: hypothetical protein JWM98_660 [Thermoleophilia bacterium]|nr:hypothetical protein [Thermoleophilia bacterium]
MMDATATRASTPGVTPQGTQASTAATATPSATGSTAGGGPSAAPGSTALLGTVLLPAPAGQPQTLSLPDGSILVPLANVNGAGQQTPLTGGAGSAALSVAPVAAAPARTAPVATAPATTATAADVKKKQGIDNTGFLYNSQWYAKYADAGGIDLADRDAVEKRVAKATYSHIVTDEPEIGDFAISSITPRLVDPVADKDLLAVDPNAYYAFDVVGRTGTGETRSIPSVMNADGAVYVDPRLTGGR